jgi:hypothetical protein
MPGGYGETDLLLLQLMKTVKWVPQKFGSTINNRDDVFLFINDILTSSDGHYGLGRLDVYESRLTAGFNFSAQKFRRSYIVIKMTSHLRLINQIVMGFFFK